MLTLQATRDCGQTPRLAFLLEELELPWGITWQANGYFLQTFGQPGPMLVDGELQVFFSGPILRHIARTAGGGRLLASTPAGAAQLDYFMDYYLIMMRSPVMALGQQRAKPEAERDAAVVERETATLKRALGRVERQLLGREWLLGDFTIADCLYGSLSTLSKIGFSLDEFPAITSYLKRIAARPAWAASLERLAAARAQ